MENFITIKENVTAEITEKKSKFIANLIKVKNKEEAENEINKIKKAYHDARHNCIAYRVIEEDRILEKSSDDGEPSGTAGGPMLNILQKSNLCNVIVVVTRYFGGILLGTGGLTRAYTQGASIAIKSAGVIEKVKGIKLHIKLDYDLFGKVQYLCNQNLWHIDNVDYTDSVEIHITAESSMVENMKNEIINSTNGKAIITEDKEENYFKEGNILFKEI